MTTVKRFEPISVMKVAAVCYAVLGLVEAALFSVIVSITPMLAHPDTKFPPFVGVMFGGFSFILFPVCFAIMGAIFGGLGALVYNVAARWAGGIQVEIV